MGARSRNHRGKDGGDAGDASEGPGDTERASGSPAAVGSRAGTPEGRVRSGGVPAREAGPGGSGSKDPAQWGPSHLGERTRREEDRRAGITESAISGPLILRRGCELRRARRCDPQKGRRPRETCPEPDSRHPAPAGRIRFAGKGRDDDSRNAQGRHPGARRGRGH